MSRSTLVERFRAARRDPALAVLEGFHALKHALRFGAELLEVATADPVQVERLARDLAPDIAGSLRDVATPVPADLFAQLAPAPPPTGIIALARRPAVDPRDALDQPGTAPVIFLEEPTSPSNLGASIRVAAAAGAAGLLSTGPHDPWGPAAIRGAAGLQYALPVARVEALPASDRPVVALDPDGDELAPGSLPPRAILAFGSERRGLSPALLARADLRLRIPMRPGVSSLNLATAVAVAVYAVR
jgi:TrmH family RNA methyltransferase